MSTKITNFWPLLKSEVFSGDRDLKGVFIGINLSHLTTAHFVSQCNKILLLLKFVYFCL